MNWDCVNIIEGYNVKCQMSNVWGQRQLLSSSSFMIIIIIFHYHHYQLSSTFIINFHNHLLTHWLTIIISWASCDGDAKKLSEEIQLKIDRKKSNYKNWSEEIKLKIWSEEIQLKKVEPAFSSDILTATQKPSKQNFHPIGIVNWKPSIVPLFSLSK